MSSFRVTTGRDGSRSFYGEHDDRDRDQGPRDGGQGQGQYSGGQRRGGRNFGRRNPRGGIYKRGRGLNPRSRLSGDDDIDMDGGQEPGSSKQRFNPYGKRQQQYGRKPGGMGGKMAMDQEGRSAHSRLTSTQSRNRRMNQRGKFAPFEVPKSPSGWYKISIPYAHKLEKPNLLKLINEALQVPFQPIGFHMDGNTAVFHVKDHDTAKALKTINKRISLPTGHKMMILVRPENNPPATEIDDEVKEKLKVCMSNRYDPATRTLNMGNMYNDDTMRKENIRLVMNRKTVMTAVLDIIQENIPELVSLDLSDNRLMSLDGLSSISIKAPNVTKLDLRNNHLRHINELNKISKLKLEELQMEGNALCDQVKDETTYVSSVRQRFPNVMKLDGHDLPPPITFGVEENTELPSTKGSYFINEDIQKRVCSFLEEYIKVYDSSDRQRLLEAYHDNAVFSLTANYNKLNPAKQGLGAYINNSRNLLRVNDNARRQKLLKHGRVNIVSQLNELPPSEHDLTSFSVDVSLATPDLMSFTLKGLFRETNAKRDAPPIRYFSRSFLTVAQGPGIVILNEEYFVSGASQQQVKEAFRTPAPTPSSSPVISAGTSAVAGPSGMGPTPEVKQEMIQQFCIQSNMNVAFSQRCLEENNWNYEAAAAVFVDLQAKGSIPPEAFIK